MVTSSGAGVVYGKHGGQVTDDEKGRTTDGGNIGAPVISTEIPVIINTAMEGDGNDNGDYNEQEYMWEISDREDEDELLFINEDNHYYDKN